MQAPRVVTEFVQTLGVDCAASDDGQIIGNILELNFKKIRLFYIILLARLANIVCIEPGRLASEARQLNLTKISILLQPKNSASSIPLSHTLTYLTIA